MYSHEFAIYFEYLDSNKLIVGSLIIDNLDIVHRLTSVLRFKIGDSFILFNRDVNCTVSIINIVKKKYIELSVLNIQKNITLMPTITFGLPVLKHSNFEEALYSIAELGVQFIQPINTDKSHNWFSKKSVIDRVNNIIISACEQSKNFRIPDLLPLMEFDEWIESIKLNSDEKIFFDISGDNAINIIKILNNKNVICCVGPEGDLTANEKLLLKNAKFKFFKLTETVLRSKQAIAVGLGMLRSLL